METQGLRNIPRRRLADEQSLRQAFAPIGDLLRVSLLRPKPHSYESVGALPIQQLTLVSFRGAATELVIEPAARVVLVGCFSASRHMRDPRGEAQGEAGGALVLPIGSGPRQLTAVADTTAAVMAVEPAAISRVAAAITAMSADPERIPACFQRFPPRALRRSEAQPLHSLLQHIDVCAGLDPRLPARLGLEDVLLRLLACWLDPELLADSSPDPRRLRERGGVSALDELVDYIRTNLDQPLRLSDLELRSRYSRRALQYAFRETFGTTPRAWIREQRLTRALQQLQSNPREGLPVRAVALACGYRHMSQFSADFRRRFGLSPSQVRRPSLR
ncbi:MAG: AraC family transcriptional regulator [Synechococcus sp.]|nr:AraC family transcriptional regulator [Synechococcus sp.]